MNERPLYFGPGNALLGILTMPTRPLPEAPGVILLNAGLLHRVGPNRLNVELARSLAEVGVTSLRFDMAGIGDSELQVGGMLDIERSRDDVVEAIDALASVHGIGQFVLVGLCTGAYNAFRAALVDDRVVGGVLIDGYSYPTPKSRLRHYRTRVFQAKRWIGFLRRKLGMAPPGPDRGDDLIIFENEYVSKERFERELGSLIDRNTQLLMIYTEMGPLAFNYPEQLHEALPSLDLDRCADVRYYEGADHTFTLPGNRRRAIDDIVAWMVEKFAGGGLVATSADVETQVGGAG